MFFRSKGALLLTALLLVAAPGAQADESGGERTCGRFAVQDAQPFELAPRLGRLCVRLINAHASPEGMSEEEVAAATRLGQYLAVVGELELRRGAAGIGATANAKRRTTDTARYLIAQRMGLLEIADALAPMRPRTASLQ